MLRTLLVLLHDFPEFLSDYHLSFCDVIPPSCIQLRNLVLAAFPRSMRLPDPFTPNLKVCGTFGFRFLLFGVLALSELHVHTLLGANHFKFEATGYCSGYVFRDKTSGIRVLIFAVSTFVGTYHSEFV